jgi:hypothetical protein
VIWLTHAEKAISYQLLGTLGGYMRTLFFLSAFIAVANIALADVYLKDEVLQEVQTSAGVTKTYVIVTKRIKGDKVRIDVEIKGLVGAQGDSTTIIDRRAGSIVRIRHATKTYEAITLSDLHKQHESDVERLRMQGKLPATRPVLKPTGRKDILKGFQTEEYVANTDDGTLTYWLAKSLLRLVPILAQSADPGGAVYMLRFPDAASLPGLAVRTVGERHMVGLRVTSTTNLLELHEKPLNDHDFDVPIGYKEAQGHGKSQ